MVASWGGVGLGIVESTGAGMWVVGVWVIWVQEWLDVWVVGVKGCGALRWGPGVVGSRGSGSQ